MKDDDASHALALVKRLEDSGALGNGGRLPALLRYLVLEEISGRGDRLKAYAIATDVLGRGREFDPQNDSIVRVEMARLRRALEYYYATTGRKESVRLMIPRGSYRPVVGSGQTQAPDAGQHSPADGAADEGFAAPAPRRSALAFVLVLASLCVAAALVWGILRAAPVPPAPPVFTGATPRLVLLPIQPSDVDSGTLAPGLRAQLGAMLAQQNWLSVSLEDALVPRGVMPPKVFSLSSVLVREHGGYTLRALLHTEPEHRIVWSGTYSSPLLHQSTVDLAHAIAGDLARDLGYPTGPLGRSIAQASTSTDADVEDRFLCMINAYRYWHGLEPKQRADALACLSRLAARHTDFVEGRAMLAMLAMEDARDGSAEGRQAALAHADALLRGAPADDRLTLSARMILKACRGEQAAAMADATALQDLAPNDPDVLSNVAHIAGMTALQWDFALQAETRALQLATQPHARYAHVRAAKAVLDGQYEAALAAISRVPQTGLELGQMMLLAVATLADAPLRASSAADALAIGYSRKIDALYARIESTCWHADVKTAFRQALEKALKQRGLR